MTAIWWVRRDFRLHDNAALTDALEHGKVIPVFVLDPTVLEGRYHRDAVRRKAFLFAGLRALEVSLDERGSRLVVREGDPAIEVPKLASQVGAETIYAARDYSPYARRRDEAVARKVDLLLTGGIAINTPESVLKDNGDPFRVFTPYSRAWLRNSPHREEVLSAPDKLPAVSDAIKSLPLPDAEGPDAFPAGEANDHGIACFAPKGIIDELQVVEIEVDQLVARRVRGQALRRFPELRCTFLEAGAGCRQRFSPRAWKSGCPNRSVARAPVAQSPA